MTADAIVKNAADRGQVKHGARKERDRRERELHDLKVVLAIPEGRRLLWRLMGFCGYGENPSNTRGDLTHQNIGKADVARFVISEIGEADGIESWLLMQREAYRDKRNEQVEAEALRTPSATKGTTE